MFISDIDCGAKGITRDRERHYTLIRGVKGTKKTRQSLMYVHQTAQSH